ncbi:MAG: SDR family NAD(P)-dependent oxidoreductase [Propioniciclava sp.]|uniref:SDR family NAD(P)-dependent oxidoreductase n=1 Tax=Propioniciclava sp. TaxID=2038686 RepID=UPI0039E47E0A
MSTALVTGATAGIGAEFARQLAARGHDLVLVARDAARLEASATALRALGVRVEALVADLADRDGMGRVAERLTDASRPVDVLVNNAGFGTTGRLDDPDTSDQERGIAVMAVAPLVLAAAAASAMKQRGHGRIINVASLSAWITQGGYSAVKAYAKVWSEGLSAQLAGSGVTATALCPGWVRTEFHQRAGLESGGIPSWVWVDAERCVRECLEHADRGKVLSIPTKRWKVAAFVLQHAPRSLVHGISRRVAGMQH